MTVRSLRTCLLITLLVIACSREQHRQPVRLGLITGLTGPTAAWGEPARNGAQLAVAEINARGGIGGRPLELVVEDDQGRPEQSASVATRLVTRDGVVGIICCDSSSRSLAAAPIAQGFRIPMISPTASLPAVTRVGDYIFRVCPTDDLEARAMARLARERLHAQRVAILRDMKNDYSVGVAAVFVEAFSRNGGTIALVRDFSEGDSDFRSQLVAIREEKPDALILPGYYGDVAQIALQARDLGIEVPLVGGSGWNSPALLEIGGHSVDGSFFLAPLRSKKLAFETAFRRRYGKLPDAPTALAYDAVALFAAALGRDQFRNQQLRDRIAATRDFDGASGRFDIGPDRNPRKALGIYTIRNGAFVEDGEVMP